MNKCFVCGAKDVTLTTFTLPSLPSFNDNLTTYCFYLCDLHKSFHKMKDVYMAWPLILLGNRINDIEEHIDKLRDQINALHTKEKISWKISGDKVFSEQFDKLKEKNERD